ncbi:L-rhamnose mutarotase [Zhihengliuella halotolerans]|uniref:L-rhamnose mutarotase n=1 Tax=Zhihengliuella halotolerans TaxID=370736 RepID=A0A4Q8AH07_9MICC|nr:L-rhamnose mutarotase [Zhihengliuella halotolerans]RZU63677.1 L-rhamnose mutarotase [Zhihengliuella halotolerans]
MGEDTTAGVADLVQLGEDVTSTRAAFLLHVKPERLAEYVEAHQRVWPEMLEALSRHGWRNYTLFLREEDGLVVGYFEADDVDAAQAAMGADPVNATWQAEMAQYFVEGSVQEALLPYFRLA